METARARPRPRPRRGCNYRIRPRPMHQCGACEPSKGSPISSTTDVGEGLGLSG